MQCGQLCLQASACAASLQCPPEAPCDPCSGQCRMRCSPSEGCKDPTKTCCEAAGFHICVDGNLDPMHCGGCNLACGGASDRCENGACVCGLLGVACVTQQLCCNESCVSVDEFNCGGCGVVCGPGEVCDRAAGKCTCGGKSSTGASCGAGQACCTGSCVTVDSDAKNCGSCGNLCGGANPTCAAGACSCQNGMCGGASQQCCGSGCVDVQISAANCGACGAPCGVNQSCVAGTCLCGGVPCAAGTTCCAGVCVDTTTSGKHCGACGVACGSGESCVAGKCVCGETSRSGKACEGGAVCCTNACVNLSTSFTNCNQCGVRCDEVRSNRCVGGTCVCNNLGAPCPSGQHCTESGCVCDAASCPGGCCRNNQCLAPSLGSCGLGGEPCAVCSLAGNQLCIDGDCKCDCTKSSCCGTDPFCDGKTYVHPEHMTVTCRSTLPPCNAEVCSAAVIQHMGQFKQCYKVRSSYVWRVHTGINCADLQTCDVVCCAGVLPNLWCHADDLFKPSASPCPFILPAGWGCP